MYKILGTGIEPVLGPHLGHTRYKLVGASNYTNPVFLKFKSYNRFINHHFLQKFLIKKQA